MFDEEAFDLVPQAVEGGEELEYQVDGDFGDQPEDGVLVPFIDATEGDIPGQDDYHEEDYLDDFPSIELTVSAESCYLLNKAYQESLEDFKRFLEQKLQENHDLQEELRDSEPQESEHIYPNSLLKFMSPYFRDVKGLTADDNEDTKSRELRGDINIFYKRLKKPWKDQEKDAIRRAIESYSLKKALEPLTKKEEHLLTKIEMLRKLQGCQEDIDQLSHSLVILRNEMDSIQQTDIKTLIPSREKSHEMDWLEISSRVSSSPHTPFDCEIKWTNDLHFDINHQPWTKEEDELLKVHVSACNFDWEAVSRALESHRMAWQCCSRYQSLFNEKLRRVGPLMQQELTLLKKLVNELRIGDYIPWHQVSYFMEKRSLSQIKMFWEKLNCPSKSVRWSQLEDQVLACAVGKFGTHCWRKVASFLPGRTNRQCRERYMMRLGFKDRKIANWTLNEDRKLITIAPSLEFRWAEMMNHLLGRNPRQIAARYDLLERYLIAKTLKSSTDLQNLVPRKKSHRIKGLSCPEVSLDEGQTVDDFLRESFKKLSTRFESGTLHKSKTLRACAGGRKKKPLKDDAIERQLVQMFAFYSLMGKTNQTNKYLARTGQECMVIDTSKSMLTSYLSGSIPRESNLLDKVISSSLTKFVLGFDPSRIAFCGPILPPNIVTTTSYQGLLLMQQNLSQQVQKSGIDASQYLYDSQYHIVLKFLISLYTWPCILSSQPPPTMKQPAKSTITKDPFSSYHKSTKRKKRRSLKQQDIMYLNDAREKQRYLFASASQQYPSDEEPNENVSHEVVDNNGSLEVLNGNVLGGEMETDTSNRS